ncbi:MAG: hypothetical protein P8Y15_14875 [Gemmatimonadales bacterium]
MPMILISPEFTQEQYEATVRKLTGGKGRLETPADWPVAGLLAHIAGQGESTFRAVVVWESDEAIARRAEIIMPIRREVGVQCAPEVYPVHTYVSAERA